MNTTNCASLQAQAQPQARTPRRALTLAEMGYGAPHSTLKKQNTTIRTNDALPPPPPPPPPPRRMADLMGQMNPPKPATSRRPLRSVNQIRAPLSSIKKNTNCRQSTIPSENIKRAITFSACKENASVKFNLDSMSDLITVKNPPIKRTSFYGRKSEISSMNRSVSAKADEKCPSAKKLSIITEDSSNNDSSEKRTVSVKPSTSKIPKCNVSSNSTVSDFSFYENNLTADTDSSLGASLCDMLSGVNLKTDNEKVLKDLDDVSLVLENALANAEKNLNDLRNARKIVERIREALGDARNGGRSLSKADIEKMNADVSSTTSSTDDSQIATARKTVKLKNKPSKMDDRETQNSIVRKTVRIQSESSKVDLETSIGLRVKLLRANAHKSLPSEDKDVTPKESKNMYLKMKKNMTFLKTPIDCKTKTPSNKLQTPRTKLSRNIQKQLSDLFDD